MIFLLYRYFDQSRFGFDTVNLAQIYSFVNVSLLSFARLFAFSALLTKTSAFFR